MRCCDRGRINGHWLGNVWSTLDGWPVVKLNGNLEKPQLDKYSFVKEKYTCFRKIESTNLSPSLTGIRLHETKATVHS